MKISENVGKKINEQIGHEFNAKYLYLSMSAYFGGLNLSGFAKWMKNQADEEDNHAMKLFGYLGERNGKVELGTLKAPQSDWKSPLDAFEAALAHEQKVTELIYGIVDAAKSEKDHATDAFLDWFVKEQVEEESSARAIVERLKRLGDSRSGIYLLDKELGERKD